MYKKEDTATIAKSDCKTDISPSRSTDNIQDPSCKIKTDYVDSQNQDFHTSDIQKEKWKQPGFESRSFGTLPKALAQNTGDSSNIDIKNSDPGIKTNKSGTLPKVCALDLENGNEGTSQTNNSMNKITRNIDCPEECAIDLNNSVKEHRKTEYPIGKAIQNVDSSKEHIGNHYSLTSINHLLTKQAEVNDVIAKCVTTSDDERCNHIDVITMSPSEITQDNYDVTEVKETIWLPQNGDPDLIRIVIDPSIDDDNAELSDTSSRKSTIVQQNSRKSLTRTHSKPSKSNLQRTTSNKSKTNNNSVKSASYNKIPSKDIAQNGSDLQDIDAKEERTPKDKRIARIIGLIAGILITSAFLLVGVSLSMSSHIDEMVMRMSLKHTSPAPTHSPLPHSTLPHSTLPSDSTGSLTN